MEDGDDLVVLTTAADPIEAEALCDFLAEHQVEAHIEGEGHDSLMGGSGMPALVDVPLLVFRRDLERAEALLEKFGEDEGGDEPPISGGGG